MNSFHYGCEDGSALTSSTVKETPLMTLLSQSALHDRATPSSLTTEAAAAAAPGETKGEESEEEEQEYGDKGVSNSCSSRLF